MLPETGIAGALAVANKLAAMVRQADIHHPRSPAGARLTISIGAATAKDLSGEPEALMALPTSCFMPPKPPAAIRSRSASSVPAHGEAQRRLGAGRVQRRQVLDR